VMSVSARHLPNHQLHPSGSSAADDHALRTLRSNAN
jgi:hypothetical protein